MYRIRIPEIKTVLLLLMVCLYLITYAGIIPAVLACNMGLVYFAKGAHNAPLAIDHWDMLAEKYLRVAKIDQKAHITSKILGRIAMESGSKEVGLTYWHKGGVDVSEIIVWGDLAGLDGRWGDAQRLYQWATELDKNSSDSWVLLGTAYEAQGKYNEAIDAYRQAISTGSYSGQFQIGRSTPYYHIGLINYKDIQSPDLDLTQSYFDKAILLDDFGSLSEIYWTFTWRAPVLMAQERYGEAIQSAEAALQLVPEGIDARLWLAKAHYKAYKDFAFAESQMQIAISQDPAYPWSYIYLGQLYQTTGNINLARQTFEAGLNVVPGDYWLEHCLEEIDDQQP